jgi:hypothetical protein
MWWSTNFGHNNRIFCCHVQFKDAGRQVVRNRIEPHTVVAVNDLGIDIHLSLFFFSIKALPYALHLKIYKESLRRGVIPAIPLSSRAAD